ncbi:MAG: ribonuclease HII [Thermodesulfovibrionaceae bacterium]
MTLYEFDNNFRAQGFKNIAGIDEAGRGSLAGPVVAACVVLYEGFYTEMLKDSKELSSSLREKVFEEIINNAFVGIGIVEPFVIDKINILEATKVAMNEAFKNLRKEVDLILIDAIQLPQIKVKQKAIPKADRLSASVAAASIVAKVIRDRIMLNYHKIYPHYGFDSHKGYLTRRHLMALRKYGPCPIHRKSFAPVRKISLF